MNQREFNRRLPLKVGLLIHLLVCLLFVSSSFGVTFQGSVSTGNDDCTEDPTYPWSRLGAGNMYIGNYSSTYPQMNFGIIFRNVNIPQGATINSASLRIYIMGGDGQTVTARILGFDNDNVSDFSTSLPSAKPKTSNPVNWSISGTTSQWKQSPDIKAIVQQIVNRSGWNDGNGMGFVIEENGTSGTYEVRPENYEDSQTYAAQLTIDWQTQTPPPDDIQLTSTDIAENAGVNAVVGDLSATGGTAPYTFSLVTGGADFNINGTQLRANASFNFEAQNSYNIRVRVEDANTQSYEEDFTINVTDVSEYSDPTPTPVAGATLSGADVTISWTAIEGATLYELNLGTTVGGNELYDGTAGAGLSANVTGLPTDGSTINARIITTDVGGPHNYDYTYTAYTLPIPDEILLTSTDIAENAGANAVVGDLSASGGTPPYTFSLVTGGADFNINLSELRANADFDFETQNTYSITIRVTDNNSQTFDEGFTINVTDVSEYADPTPTPAVASTLSGADVTISWTAVEGATLYELNLGTSVGGDNLYNGTPGAATSVDVTGLPTDGSLINVRIITTDVGGPHNFDYTYTAFTPSGPDDITLTNSTIAENAGANAVVGDLSASGGTPPYTFSLVNGGTDFNINLSELRANTDFDFETQNTYSITIRVTDNNSQTFDEGFTINVTDVSEYADPTPTPAVASTLSGADVTISWTAVEGATLYELNLGTTVGGNELFDGTAGAGLSANVTGLPTDGSTINARIITTDVGGPHNFDFTYTAFTLGGPGDIQLTSTDINENAGANAVVGDLSASGGTPPYTFSLVNGGTDFNINLSELRANTDFDFETQNTYNITVRVTDDNSQQFDKGFTINVTDVSEYSDPTPTPAAGSILSGADVTISWTAVEGASSYELNMGTNVGGDNLYNGTPGAATSVDVTGLPTDGSLINVRIITTDVGGPHNFDYTYTASSPGGPDDITLTNNTIAENAGANAVVGDLSATGGTPPYTFSLVSGGTDFNINLSELRANTDFDFETQNTYNITVRVTDDNSQQFDKGFTINVTDVSEYTDPTPTPAAGATLSGPDVTISWTAVEGASTYELDLGTTVGGNELYNGTPGAATSVDVTGLPTDGSLINVRIITTDVGGPHNFDFTYTASSGIVYAFPQDCGPNENMQVEGQIKCNSLLIYDWLFSQNGSNPGAPDYVFEKGYNLKSLKEIEQYIKEKGHLPEMPGAKELKEKGVDMIQFNFLLLQKVEEMMLHMIRQEKEIEKLKRKMKR